MNSMDQQQIKALRESLLSLANCCPFDHCNPEDCPIYPLRKQNPKERLHWFNALTGQDLMDLAAYHNVCLNVKMMGAEFAETRA